MDVETLQQLMEAVENDGNSSILELTNAKVKQYKNNALQQLNLPRDKLIEYNKKLKEYRFIEGLNELQYGQYIRWIPLNITELAQLKLTRGGIVVDARILDETGIHLTCKNSMNRFFQIRFDECMVFQKLTPNEMVLLSVMDYLNKT
tara:strand:+ start:1457 stop:1897 length:441 start_codon:yes stop_codon:yes gene_type:complete